jgi:hypothetical protein
LTRALPFSAIENPVLVFIELLDYEAGFADSGAWSAEPRRSSPWLSENMAGDAQEQQGCKS